LSIDAIDLDSESRDHFILALAERIALFDRVLQSDDQGLSQTLDLPRSLRELFELHAEILKGNTFLFKLLLESVIDCTLLSMQGLKLGQNARMYLVYADAANYQRTTYLARMVSLNLSPAVVRSDALIRFSDRDIEIASNLLGC
jgi:hypothetical protein